MLDIYGSRGTTFIRCYLSIATSLGTCDCGSPFHASDYGDYRQGLLSTARIGLGPNMVGGPRRAGAQTGL